jgi:hypothetical protein
MPYSNPKDKRRWEREHRQQRNDRRRQRRSGTQMAIRVPNPAPDPILSGEPTSVGCAITIGIVVLSVGLLLLALAVWKARKKKLISMAHSQIVKGRSE